MELAHPRTELCLGEISRAVGVPLMKEPLQPVSAQPLESGGPCAVGSEAFRLLVKPPSDLDAERDRDLLAECQDVEAKGDEQ